MDLTTINNIWRPVHGELVRALALLTPEWEDLQRLQNFTQKSLRSINWPVELVHGGGIAYTEDGGSTARATSNEPPEATDTWKHMVGRFEVGFDALDAENGSGGFSSAQIEPQVRYQAGDKLRSFRRTVASSFYGHNTGILFLATGTASNPSGSQTALVVDSLYGEAGVTFDLIRDYMTKDKDFVVVHEGETAAERGEGLLVAIDESNNEITLDSDTAFNAAVADGDAVVLKNQVLAGAASDLDRAINGMLDLTRATTLHGISETNFPDWSAGVDVTGYGQALAGKDLFKWMKDVEQRSDRPVQFAYTTVGVVTEGGGAQLDQRRYDATTDTMRLGFQNVVTQGVELEPRPYVPNGFLFLGSEGSLKKLSPDEEPQNVVDQGEKAGSFQQYQDRLGFFKDQVFRAQLTAVSRLGLGVVDGITEA